MKKPKILAIDDEAFNLDILQTDLEDADFEVIRADGGEEGLAKLKEHPDIHVILLDRMMPGMDGIQVTQEIKGNPLFRNIPIIMQTAAGQSAQVKEGLQAGVYYYLIKPFKPDLLMSIVRAALNESFIRQEAIEYVSGNARIVGLMRTGHFHFRTLQDVRSLAHFIASCCPRPDVVTYGLNELMINAVEHGNLNISYMEKLELVTENRWQQEVERRLALEENHTKYGNLTFQADEKAITITIKDKGRGFDWKQFIEFDPMRLGSDPNGKGIAITKVTSLPNLEYRADGSEVICRIDL